MAMQKCPGLVVIDLLSAGNLSNEGFRNLTSCCPNTAALAFGPHAQASLLREARSLGIRKVVPNYKLEEAFLATVKQALEDHSRDSQNGAVT